MIVCAKCNRAHLCQEDVELCSILTAFRKATAPNDGDELFAYVRYFHCGREIGRIDAQGCGWWDEL